MTINPARIAAGLAALALCFGLWFVPEGRAIPWGPELGRLAQSQITPASDCGSPIRPLAFYDRVSRYCLGAAFVLILGGILVDRKKLKFGLFLLAVGPLAGWVYVNFLVDYDKIRQTLFNYNLRAEATLANIAEAQARYKSEQDTYIKDLDELESHLSGAHGIDECVRILSLNVSWDHWSAEAQHVSSPEIVKWDSTSGSSLKKG